MVSDLKKVMVSTKEELNKLSLLLDEQYDVILNKDIIRMTEIEKSITCINKSIAILELKRRDLVGDGVNLDSLLRELNSVELFELQKEIEIVISMLQIQKDSNMKLLKQLLYFSNKMINAIKPVDTYGTYNSSGSINKGF